MAKKFRDLRSKMAPQRQERAAARARAMLAEMPLYELRQARQMSQETLAETLEISQSSVSKLERRVDVYVSTLRRYIQAMGGELEITARFADGDVRINQFEQIDPDEEHATERTVTEAAHAALTR